MFKVSKMTKYYDLFKVSKLTILNHDLFKGSKMTFFNYDLFKVSKMTSTLGLRLVGLNNYLDVCLCKFKINRPIQMLCVGL